MCMISTFTIDYCKLLKQIKSEVRAVRGSSRKKISYYYLLLKADMAGLNNKGTDYCMQNPFVP